jgi:membrane dipeptidase
MPSLEFVDHRADPAAWAEELSISREAVELYLDSDVIDLHIDSFIWWRIFGYDLEKRHDRGFFGGRFYSQVDFPRILEAAVTGATWVITTNPARDGRGRLDVFLENVDAIQRIFERVNDQFQLVRTTAEYQAARAAGKHAAFIGVQGGNALDESLDAFDRIPDRLLLRVTVVHLSSSRLGVTSSPAKIGGDTGLTDLGHAFVERLNEKKIFVDLAHISKKGFWDAVKIHDKSQPLIVTHTGISGVFEHWRNLDDDQLRAIADSGGTIGVMYQSSFLGDRYWGGSSKSIVDHLAHIVDTVGEDHASLGSDWDGAIIPPRDMPTCLELPRLVQHMLDRDWSPSRIQKILGKNFLRTVAALRG